ncbi:hypothetical protein ACR77M_22065 [Enterococcus avium]|uniref:hypothetical protein n=1 Tax=Enterococcus avium TaxID=33945 RepID=UPI003DA5CC2E
MKNESKISVSQPFAFNHYYVEGIWKESEVLPNQVLRITIDVEKSNCELSDNVFTVNLNDKYEVKRIVQLLSKEFWRSGEIDLNQLNGRRVILVYREGTTTYGQQFTNFQTIIFTDTLTKTKINSQQEAESKNEP